MAPLQASLELFLEAGNSRLRRKRRALSRFMRARIEALLGNAVEIVTPEAAQGAQVSMRVQRGAASAAECAEALLRRRIVIDAREPDILRMAAVPLYNRFYDVERAVRALASMLK
jgi:kynureninase